MSYNIPKTIWYISKYAKTPNFGDPGRQFFFAKYMAKYNNDILLISSRSSACRNIPSLGLKNQIYYKIDGVKGVVLNGIKITLGFNVKRVYSWIIFEFRLLFWAFAKSEKRPDVIIVSSLSLLTFLSGCILKRYYKCKLICEVRDIWPLTLIVLQNWNRNNLFISLLGSIERLGYKNADKIIGTMPNLIEHVVSINPDYASKVVYIPTGYDPDFYSEPNDDIINIDKIFAKIPSDNFIIGYAGTIGKANCIDQIIEAAFHLKMKPISFLILGNGVLRKDVEVQVNNLGLKNVFFINPVPKKVVFRILSRCHVLLNPWKGGKRIYKFGVSPNKWIDYMYSARPIIVSLDGFRNIINEARCGVFIKADDVNELTKTIEEFHSMDRNILDQMGMAGKTYLINNLSYDVLTQKYLRIIDEI